jgi:hypothetical protein
VLHAACVTAHVEGLELQPWCGACSESEYPYACLVIRHAILCLMWYYVASGCFVVRDWCLGFAWVVHVLGASKLVLLGQRVLQPRDVQSCGIVCNEISRLIGVRLLSTVGPV